MTNRRSTIKALTAGLLTAAAITLAALALQAQPAPAPEPAPTATPALSADLEGEIWWTTTDCPAGVQVPCIDPTVAVVTPDSVSGATWQALLDAGYRGDPTDGAEQLYVPAEVLAQLCDIDTDCEGLEV